MPSTHDSMYETYAAPQLASHFGVSVKLRRGASESASFTASWEMHEYTVVDRDGFATQVQSRDWIALASDLVIDSQAVTPRPGDRIEDVESGQLFELMPLGSKPAAELMAGDYRWRLHTKRVS